MSCCFGRGQLWYGAGHLGLEIGRYGDYYNPGAALRMCAGNMQYPEFLMDCDANAASALLGSIVIPS